MYPYNIYISSSGPWCLNINANRLKHFTCLSILNTVITTRTKRRTVMASKVRVLLETTSKDVYIYMYRYIIFTPFRWLSFFKVLLNTYVWWTPSLSCINSAYDIHIHARSTIANGFSIHIHRMRRGVDPPSNAGFAFLLSTQDQSLRRYSAVNRIDVHSRRL